MALVNKTHVNCFSGWDTYYCISLPSNDVVWFKSESPIGKGAKRRCGGIRSEAQVCELDPALTQICMFVRMCPQMIAGGCESVCVCVCVWWDADTARASFQSDPFGRESRTNQIIVLVWH